MTAAILAVGFALMLAFNLPGQLSYDSVSQLFEARAGAYNSWHPAIMAWLLGLFDALLPGTALFVIFEAGLLALAMALSLRCRAGWSAALVALCIVVTPQFLLFQGTVWKDVLFADMFVLAFSALARAACEHGTARWLLCLLFFLSLGIAALTRQNGLLLLPFGALALGWILAAGNARRVAFALAALLMLAGLVAGASLLLAGRGDGGEGLRAEIQRAQLYDLTGAARRGYRLDLLRQNDPSLARIVEQNAVRVYTPQMEDTLVAVLPDEIPPRVVAAQWRTLLLTRPGLYLRERVSVFWQVVATPDIAQCHPAYAGIAGDPAQLAALGLTARIRPQDARLAAYARAFMGTPVLSHLVFAVLAVMLLLLYLRRRHPADIPMIAMLAAALVFAASFFFVSMACDYRYLYPLDLVAMLALFHICAGPIQKMTKI